VGEVHNKCVSAIIQKRFAFDGADLLLEESLVTFTIRGSGAFLALLPKRWESRRAAYYCVAVAAFFAALVVVVLALGTKGTFVRGYAAELSSLAIDASVVSRIAVLPGIASITIDTARNFGYKAAIALKAIVERIGAACSEPTGGTSVACFVVGPVFTYVEVVPRVA
jgi:hypothetical protein